MLCIHLGPGRLGLGLVIDTLLERDLRVCLLGAQGSSPADVLQHEITFTGGRTQPLTRPVHWVHNPADAADLDPQVLRLLDGRGPVLITGSLAGQAAECEHLLRGLLKRRPADAETVVLACENDADPMYAKVTSAFADVHYCECVVDRVVNWNYPERYADGRRRIVAHTIGQWVIYHPDPEASQVLTRLRAASPVIVVDDEHLLAGYRKRKRWVVNGGHLVMALIERYNGVDRLPLTVQAERFDDVRARVMPVIDTAMQAIEREHPELAWEDGFVEDRMRVFRETPGSASRILQGRLVRADLRPLMKHFDLCVGEAAREVCRLGLPSHPYEAVVDLLLDTFERRTVYLDQCAPKDLSAVIDGQVVQAFLQIADWMDAGHAYRAAVRLGRMLAIHRRDKPPDPPVTALAG